MTKQITQTPEKQLAFHLDQMAACESSFVEHAYDAGVILSRQKDRLEHGDWLEWLKENFSRTRQTATAYIQLAAQDRSEVVKCRTITEAKKRISSPPDPVVESEPEIQMENDFPFEMENVGKMALIESETDPPPPTGDYNPDDIWGDALGEYEDDDEPTAESTATASLFIAWIADTKRILPLIDESDAELAHAVIDGIWPRKPTKSKNEAIEKPGDVTSGTWKDWLAARKAKKAGPVTLSVIKAVIRESEKAGICIDEALSRAAGRGWQTYRADWDDDLAKESVGARSMREKL